MPDNDGNRGPTKFQALAAGFADIIPALLAIILLLLGYVLVTRASALDFGIGESVIASGIVSFLLQISRWVDRRYQREENNEHMRQLTESISDQIALGAASLERSLDDALNRQRDIDRVLGEYKEMGLVRMYDDRLVRTVYKTHQAAVQHTLDILGLGLQFFQEDVVTDLFDWVVKRENLRVRILSIDPRSPYCNSRAREASAGDSASTPNNGIAAWSLRLAERIQEHGHQRIEHHWYMATPTVTVYHLDDTVFVGPYLVGRPGRTTLTLQLTSGGRIALQYLKHFDVLWSGHRAIDEPWSYIPTADMLAEARKTLGMA